MKFARSVGWVFSGLLLAASCAYAQEAANRTASSAESHQRAEAKPEAKAKPDAGSAAKAARKKLLSDADALMADGKPADAYALLEPFESDRSGEVLFDYRLGIAALGSDKPDKAVLAFERVLAVDKNFAGVRLDMARAYFKLGDLPRARTEFQAVMAQNPSESVKVAIKVFLDAIKAKEDARQTGTPAGIEGAIGHDNDANNSAITKKPKTSKGKALADNAVPAKPKKLTKSQQAEQVRQAAETQAKTEQETKTLAEAEARMRAETEAKARTEAEARARTEAEAKAKRDAEIAAREKFLSDADALMAAGKPADAYALLEPLEFERSGEVRFDYLIGIAALDSGKPDKATIAFERVLAVDPNFAGARLDMARAYFQLGDLPRARTEFQQVMEQNPPDAAKVTIQKFLDAIKAQEETKRTHITGYIEGVAGRDNNVNNSTSQAQILVPLFNAIFTLNPTNVKMADNYSGLAAGAEINRQLNQGATLYAGADVHQHSNVSKTDFSSTTLDEHAGISFVKGKEIFNVGVLGSQFSLANTHNRDTTGINTEWRHTFSPSNQFNAFAQLSKNRFVDDAMKVNDFDVTTLGVGWMHVLPNGKSVLFGSLYHGRENDIAPVTVTNPDGGRADGNKSFNGLRAGAQTPVRDNLDLFASFGFQQGMYDKYNVAFMQTRVDRMDDFSVGANWHWDKSWTIRPQAALSRNNSNIEIYSFDRTDVSVTVRKDFR